MRIACLSFVALLAVPPVALAADENVTPRLRGALVQFESGTSFAFYSRGGFVVTRDGQSFRGRWWFKPDRSAYCGTVDFGSGAETSCNKIVKRGIRYVELAEKGDGGATPIAAIAFNKFRK